MSGHTCVLTGTLLGMLAVALGAYGAHGLEKSVATWNLEPAEQAKRLQDWEVGVRYQMYHALALLALGALVASRPMPGAGVAALALLVGVLLFSGCLYLYVFSGLKWLGMIVPVGGLSLIVGWLMMGLAVLRGDLRPPAG